MSKKLDLTQAGGFPLEQDWLDWLQSFARETLTGFAMQGGATGPFIISGCNITKTLVSGTTYNYAVTAGLIFYNNDLYVVQAFNLMGVDTSVNAPYFVITQTSTVLTYNSGGTHAAVTDAYINSGVAQAIGTGDDATHLNFGSLVLWGRENTWSHIAVSTGAGFGSVTGDIYYKKNFISNELSLYVNLFASTPNDFASMPNPGLSVMATLPVGYRPSKAAFVKASVVRSPAILDSSNFMYIRDLTMAVAVIGAIEIEWLRSSGGITYSCVWFGVIPLD